MKKLLVLMIVLFMFSFSFSNEVENEVVIQREDGVELSETPVLEEINLTELVFEQEVNLLKGDLLIINRKLEELEKNLLEKNIKIDNLENKLENVYLGINNLENQIKSNRLEVTTSIYEKLYRYGVIFICVVICGLLILISMIVFQNNKNTKKIEEWSELIELKNSEDITKEDEIREDEIREDGIREDEIREDEIKNLKLRV